MILAEDTTMIPLNCKLRLLPSHSGLLMPLNQLAKELLFWLGGIDPGYQKKLGEHSTVNVRRSVSGIQGSLRTSLSNHIMPSD